MADLDNLTELSASEIEEDEKRRRQRLTLDQEIARKYDANRLSTMVIQGAGRGERLDLATRMEMERRIPGNDFSKVRVFRGAFAEEITAKYKADAVTVANTGMILMRGSARSAPGTTAHQALLAHELTHVAQAQRGMQFALESGGEDGEHEKQAREAEAGVTHNKAAPDKHAGIEKALARRKKIIERAMEIIGEQRQISEERLGRL